LSKEYLLASVYLADALFFLCYHILIFFEKLFTINICIFVQLIVVFILSSNFIVVILVVFAIEIDFWYSLFSALSFRVQLQISLLVCMRGYLYNVYLCVVRLSAKACSKFGQLDKYANANGEW